MDTLLSYELRDFLMFSPSVYWRMIERLNETWWPFQWIMPVLVIIACAYTFKKCDIRPMYIVGAMTVITTGYVFFYQAYAQIMTAAPYFALAFVIQAMFMLGYAFKQHNASRMGLHGYWLIGFGLLIQPFVGQFWGRQALAYESVGLLPDPTITVIFGMLLATKLPLWLYSIPALWGIISGLSLYAMEDTGFWIMPAITILSLLLYFNERKQIDTIGDNQSSNNTS